LYLAGLLLLLSPALAAGPVEATLQIPAHITTHEDGRAPIQQLYASCMQLLEQGWTLDIVYDSQPSGTCDALPSIDLHENNLIEKGYVYSQGTFGAGDELMSSPTIIDGGRVRAGPNARTMLVFETPAKNTTLAQRIEAHSGLIRQLSRHGVAGRGYGIWNVFAGPGTCRQQRPQRLG
jgi:hypothetical protein